MFNFLTSPLIPFFSTDTFHRLSSPLFNLKMAAQRDFVASITTGRDSWNIVCKVVRLWTVPNLNGQKIPYSLDMVLMDERVVFFSSLFTLNMYFFLKQP